MSIRTSGSAFARAAALAALCAGGAQSAHGARLLMFTAPDCEFCVRWEAEVGGVYPHTEEARLAPLERTARDAPVPAGVRLAAPVRYTPTFVLVDDGAEVGRITGYPGEAHFWGLLGALLERRAVVPGG